jgi:hypothetical protein
MFQCIGHTKDRQGRLVRCYHISQFPTGKWDIFLCTACANSLPNNRPQLKIESLEVDKPNYDEDNPESFPVRTSQDEIDLEDFRHLDELDAWGSE